MIALHDRETILYIILDWWIEYRHLDVPHERQVKSPFMLDIFMHTICEPI